jgi:pimeloyl-ACP methyl ester carboxylesterase
MADYADLFFKSHCGHLRLYARDYGPPNATTCVLCMHGLTRNSADFAWLARHLADRYRVICPDQRGRGRSDYDPDKANYHPDIYVKDMVQLLDHLGIGRLVLIGTSMGGLMAMLMGASMPERISGIVLNDVGPEVSAAGIERIRGYVGKMSPPASWEEAASQAEFANGIAFPDHSAADWMAFARRTYVERDYGRPVPAYDPAIAEGLAPTANTAIPPDLWPLWDALGSIPIMAIRGALSDILTVETLGRMSERHPGMVSVTIPNRGHAPMLDEPDAVVAIDRFLSELESRP